MNPELKRNYWLEITKGRLLIIPGMAVLWMAFISSIFSDFEARDEFLRISFMVFTGFCLFLWAPKEGGESIFEEATARTWVFQKMTRLSSREMLFGKFVGPALFPLYSALICTLITLFFSTQNQSLLFASLGILAFMWGLGVVMQSLSIGIALLGLEKIHTQEKKRRNNSYFPGLFIALFTFPSLFMALANPQDLDFVWYGIELHTYTALFFILGYFVFWGLYACDRLMKKELLFKTNQLIWIYFGIATNVFMNGFLVSLLPENSISLFHFWLLSALAQWILLAYLSFTTSTNDPIEFKHFKNALANNNLKELFQHTPPWILSLLIAFLLGIVSTGGGSYNLNPEFAELREIIPASLGVFPLLLPLYALRDFSILLLIRSWAPRHPTLFQAFYLIFIYLFFPFFATEAEWPFAFRLSFPTPLINEEGLLAQCLPILLQLSLLVFLAKNTLFPLLQSFGSMNRTKSTPSQN